MGSIDLVKDANKDPAPDLLDNASNDQYVFVGLRGPNPLTGNDKMAHNAKGTIPGVGVIQVDGGGKVGHYKGQATVTNMKEGKETADPHGSPSGNSVALGKHREVATACCEGG